MKEDQQIHYLVYKTVNTVNNKVYIGSHRTQNIDDGYLGSGTLLKRSIKKYGKEFFTRTIIKQCSSAEEMFEVEFNSIHQYLTEGFTLYNIVLVGEFLPDRGDWMSEEHKEKLRLALKGNQNHKGHKHSDSAKQKMSEKHKGREYTKGYKHTDSAKEKMSQKARERIVSVETREKHRNNMLSRINEDYKAECSARMKAIWAKRKEIAEC